MRTIVSKFGGSSTASADQLRRVFSIIRASPARRCVVLSAPGEDAEHGEKVTALLAECWRSRGDEARLAALKERIAARYEAIARGLGLPDVSDRVEAELDEALSISEAHTLSRGEYLCALLFSRYSGLPMIDAADAVAFDAHGDIDALRTRRALLARFGAAGGRAVLPGFYGAGPTGAIRTFPRNGSDITGAWAAACLEAGLYENWTDVPGLMTADPAVVPGARLIPQVGYRQMRMLARAGARVLHPSCLDPVAMAGIPTRLRCTLRPGRFGTLIDDGVCGVAKCVASRALPDGTALVSVFGVDPNAAREAARALDPLRVEADDGVCRVLLPHDRAGDAVRTLHDQLIVGAIS